MWPESITHRLSQKFSKKIKSTQKKGTKREQQRGIYCCVLGKGRQELLETMLVKQRDTKRRTHRRFRRCLDFHGCQFVGSEKRPKQSHAYCNCNQDARVGVVG